MQITNGGIRKLTVLYDATCDFCIGCANWVYNEPMYFEVEMIPLQAEETRKRFPSLKKEIEKTRFIAVDNKGGVYFDTDARLMVIYALQNYRSYALKLADPRFRKWTDRIFEQISNNRNKLGFVFADLSVRIEQAERREGKNV